MKAKFNAKLWLVSSLLLVLISRSPGASDILRLEVTPSTVKLQLGEEREICVLARNISSDQVQLGTLSWLDAPGISLSNTTVTGSALKPESTAKWILKIKRTRAGEEADQAFFSLDFRRNVSSAITDVVNVATGTLEIQATRMIPLDQVVEVRIESALKSIREPQTNAIYVLMKNKGLIPISIDTVNFEAPPDVSTVTVFIPQAVKPREEASIKAEITARKKVNPGKHLLLVEVGFSWTESGIRRTGSAYSKYEFDVDVFGSSDFLVPIGVPSFFLLPGFLFVLTFTLLWNAAHKEKPFPVQVKSAEFWCLSVVVSLLAITAYRYWGTDLLQGYGLKDVYSVWFGAIGSGLLLWVILQLCLLVRRKYKAWNLRRRSFKKSDDPWQTLQKLILRRGGFLLDRIKISIEGQETLAFALQTAELNQGSIWIAPEILVSFSGIMEAARKKALSEQFEIMLSVREPAAEVLKFLRSAQVELNWAVSAGLRGVTEVQSQQIVNTGHPEYILRRKI